MHAHQKVGGKRRRRFFGSYETWTGHAGSPGLSRGGTPIAQMPPVFIPR
ncbi:hypothetical protein AKJ08_2102 [Vulgatibacter incomptus]|uniref:Uncharacterized protein n=1 Tax=Vulgatibacter incomptus TaxID=1391653 RepID=A0A0K1PDY0_9BACT|nr:hypothetical protein AKJ08_2102 [Vulgatibacter incomptus]